MSYKALYRKWRPERFSEVKGQDAIVKTLQNQINSGRIGHAYIFCGTRGTGKTTVAKIFSRVVNCESPINGEACMECRSCKAITEGTSMNVVEIDAASNNGVDSIRDIRDDVSYSPAYGKYKVYIIDEAHMITKEAFNALLKTLEEPPEYAIFIFATTEINKIPLTILSRCQRYDFKRIPLETIVERLKELIEGEKIEAEDKALFYIARRSDGALRDAISLLDQSSSFLNGKELTYEGVLDVLGAVDTVMFSELLRSIMTMNIKAASDLIDEIVLQGKELYQFVTDFSWYLRNILLVKASEDENIEGILDISKDNLLRLKEEAGLLDEETIIRYIRIFSDLLNDLRYTSQKRVLTEIAVIKLCRPETESDDASALERIRILEKEVDTLKNAINEIKLDPSKAGEIKLESREPAVKEVVIPLPKDVGEKVMLAGKKRAEIVGNLSKLMREMLNGSTWSAEEKEKLLIIPREELLTGFLKTETYTKALEEAIEKVVGEHVDFEIRSPKRNPLKKEIYTELNTIEGIDMEIEEEE